MIYKEKQYLRQPLIWIPTVIVLAIFIYALVQQIFLGEPFGENPAPDWVLILFGLIPLILGALFLFGHLDTTIDEEEITIRLVPIHLKPIKFSWNEIDKAYIRKYRPIMEYGGWGLRYTFRNGKAYNVSGKMGLQLELKSGKKILIGTKEPDKMRNALGARLTEK